MWFQHFWAFLPRIQGRNRHLASRLSSSEQKSVESTLKSLLLPVTCYCRGRIAQLCVLAMPSFQVRFLSASKPFVGNGGRWDLQRTYNGFTTEPHRREKFSPNLNEACINLGDGVLEWFSRLFWRIMCILWLTLKITELLLPELFFAFFKHTEQGETARK